VYHYEVNATYKTFSKSYYPLLRRVFYGEELYKRSPTNKTKQFQPIKLISMYLCIGIETDSLLRPLIVDPEDGFISGTM